MTVSVKGPICRFGRRRTLWCYVLNGFVAILFLLRVPTGSGTLWCYVLNGLVAILFLLGEPTLTLDDHHPPSRVGLGPYYEASSLLYAVNYEHLRATAMHQGLL